MDHYGIDKNWESYIAAECKTVVIAIDDLDRDHDCHTIIDQNLWPFPHKRYIKSKAQVLIGPKYALLRPVFSLLKEQNLPKKEQLLVFFGGNDVTHQCEKFLKAVCHIGELPFNIKLVAGRQTTNIKALQELAKDVDVEVFSSIDNFEYEMAVSKYAIGASGISNWERFCLHLPTSVVSVADNQTDLSKVFSFKKSS